jgi:hypothetical protein
VTKRLVRALARLLQAIAELLLAIAGPPDDEAVTLDIRAGVPTEQDHPSWTVHERQIMLLLTDTQKVTLSIDPRNAKGNPAPVDGVPEWAVSNPGVGTITPSADGLSATFVATTGGDTQVSVTADADLGDGVRSLSATLDISVKPGEAVTLGITAGTPEEQ